MQKLQTANDFIKRMADIEKRNAAIEPDTQLLCLNLMNRRESLHLCYMGRGMKGWGILHRFKEGNEKISAIYSPAGWEYFRCDTTPEAEKEMIDTWNEFCTRPGYDPFYNYGSKEPGDQYLLYFERKDLRSCISSAIQKNLYSSSAAGGGK